MIDEDTKQTANRVLTWVLFIALVLALVGVGYVAMSPSAQEDPFTEFYILGPEGEAADYPTNLTVGEEGELIVGITNNEHRDMTYTVVLATGGDVLEERTVDVPDGATWEDDVTFVLDDSGEHRVEILLFVGEAPDSLEDPYRELRLVVEVRD